jgi:hypothetical protein
MQYEVYDSQTSLPIEGPIEDQLEAFYRAGEYNRVRGSTQYAVRPSTETV